jgi:hypothetical protein
MIERFSLEVLCIYMKMNSFLIISGYHLMVHLKGADDFFAHTRTQDMILIGFATT